MLNLGWFAKQSKYPKKVVDKIFLSFAVSFLAIRVLWMSGVVSYLAFKREKQMAELGVGKHGLYLVALLQHWWFYKIARIALSR